MKNESLKEQVRKIIMATLVVRNPQSFDFTWKLIEPLLNKEQGAQECDASKDHKNY